MASRAAFPPALSSSVGGAPSIKPNYQTQSPRLGSERTPNGLTAAIRAPLLATGDWGLAFWRLATGDYSIGGVPYVWKLSTVLTPHACPFARSASFQTVGSGSGS